MKDMRWPQSWGWAKLFIDNGELTGTSAPGSTVRMGSAARFGQVPSSLLLQRVPNPLTPLDPTSVGKCQEAKERRAGSSDQLKARSPGGRQAEAGSTACWKHIFISSFRNQCWFYQPTLLFWTQPPPTLPEWKWLTHIWCFDAVMTYNWYWWQRLTHSGP